MSTPIVPSVYGSDVKEIQNAVKELFTHLVATLKTDPQSAQGRTIFFPNGIELIAVKLNAGSAVQFSFAIAGEKAPKIEQLYSSPEGQTLGLDGPPE